MCGIVKYLDRFAVAESNFNWATNPMEIDAAIYEMMAAELYVANYITDQIKKECVKE